MKANSFSLPWFHLIGIAAGFHCVRCPFVNSHSLRRSAQAHYVRKGILNTPVLLDRPPDPRCNTALPAREHFRPSIVAPPHWQPKASKSRLSATDHVQRKNQSLRE